MPTPGPQWLPYPSNITRLDLAQQDLGKRTAISRLMGIQLQIKTTQISHQIRAGRQSEGAPLAPIHYILLGNVSTVSNVACTSLVIYEGLTDGQSWFCGHGRENPRCPQRSLARPYLEDTVIHGNGLDPTAEKMLEMQKMPSSIPSMSS